MQKKCAQSHCSRMNPPVFIFYPECTALMQHHDEGLDHFGAKCHFLPLLTIHPFSTAASRTLRVAWVLGFYPSSTYHQGHVDSQTNIHAHTHSQQPISRSTFLVYWQVTDACVDNVEQLFCRLSDTVSQKIIG